MSNLGKTAALTIVAFIVVNCSVGSVAHAEELLSYSGAELFQRFCASCHGPQGRGDGPVAPSLKGTVPDLTEFARRHGGEFKPALARRIVDGRAVIAPHGPRQMPVWGLEFWYALDANAEARQRSTLLIDRLMDYLQSIQRDR